MVRPEGVAWHADSDDPYDPLPRGGAWAVALALVPVAALLCLGAVHAGTGWVALALGAPVPGAVLAALWWYLIQRHRVVEIRLVPAQRPDRVTVVRVDRSTSTYPVGEVALVEVTRSATRRSSSIRLYVGGGVERSRRGPADLPATWLDAIGAAGITLQVRTQR